MNRWNALSRAQKIGATAATAAGLAVVGWFVNWSMPQIVDRLFPPAEVSATGRLLIVDTSSAMGGEVGRRRFKAAVAEINRMVSNEPDIAFALRTAGGSCTSGYAEPVVGFDEDNDAEIRSALTAARPQGPPNIISQLQQGISDFNRFDTVKSSQVQAVWLFLASARDCSDRQSSLGAAIKAELSGALRGVSHVDFFVLRGDRKSIAAMKASLGPLGDQYSVTHVPNPKALKTAVTAAAMKEKPSD